MRLLSEMTFYTSYNAESNMWEVRDIQEEITHGMFSNKADAFEFCREMNSDK